MIEEQINALKKEVSYDTRDFTIEIIVKKYSENIEKDANEIFVPEYQRDFVWSQERQSKMIESIILGLPIPSIFVAEDESGRLEIVDGSQRIRTLNAFLCGDLQLINLKKITSLNDKYYENLAESRQRKFKNTSVSMIVLSEETTQDMRNDLFERINKGSDILRNMEVRKGIYLGQFTDFLYNDCSKNERFKSMINLSKSVKNRQEYEELILRFFAFKETYPRFQSFSRNVGLSLDKYIEEKNRTFNPETKKEMTFLFENMVNFVHKNFIYGFSKDQNKETSRMYFEAISVGVAFALQTHPNLELSRQIDPQKNLFINQHFKAQMSSSYRTHATQSIIKRIDFVKETLLKLKK